MTVVLVTVCLICERDDAQMWEGEFELGNAKEKMGERLWLWFKLKNRAKVEHRQIYTAEPFRSSLFTFEV